MPRAVDPALTLLGTVLLAIAGPSPAFGAAPETPPPVSVRFELNDAQVKGRALEGVAVSVSPAAGGGEVASGRTGSDGRWTTRLAPGTYEVSYRLDGYVPYTSGATEVREDGQLVTVSLSRLLEATESGGREVRIILNWGSRPDQVRDADSHLACPCGAADGHVYYQARVHEAAGHRVELDVDDTDWGGPETITLTRPAAGHVPLLGARLQRPAGDARGLRRGRARRDRSRGGRGVPRLQGHHAAGLAAVQGHRGRRGRPARRSCASPRTRSRRPPTSPCPPISSRPKPRRPRRRLPCRLRQGGGGPSRPSPSSPSSSWR